MTTIEEVRSLKVSTKDVSAVNVRLAPVKPACSYKIAANPGATFNELS